MPALRKTLDRITARRRQPSRPALPSNQQPINIARPNKITMAPAMPTPVIPTPAPTPVNMSQQLLNTTTPAPPPAAQAMPGGPDMYGPDAQGFVPQPPTLATVQPTPPPPQAPPQPELGQQPGAFGQVSPPTAPPPVPMANPLPSAQPGIPMAAPQPVDAQQLAQQYSSVLNGPAPTAPTIEQLNQMRGYNPVPDVGYPPPMQMGGQPGLGQPPLPNGVDPGSNMTLSPEYLNARYSAKATGSPVPTSGWIRGPLRGDVYGPSPADMTAMIPGQPV